MEARGGSSFLQIRCILTGKKMIHLYWFVCINVCIGEFWCCLTLSKFIRFFIFILAVVVQICSCVGPLTLMALVDYMGLWADNFRPVGWCCFWRNIWRSESIFWRSPVYRIKMWRCRCRKGVSFRKQISLKFRNSLLFCDFWKVHIHLLFFKNILNMRCVWSVEDRKFFSCSLFW